MANNQPFPVMQTMDTISPIGHLAGDGQSSVSSRLLPRDSFRKLYHEEPLPLLQAGVVYIVPRNVYEEIQPLVVR